LIHYKACTGSNTSCRELAAMQSSSDSEEEVEANSEEVSATSDQNQSEIESTSEEDSDEEKVISTSVTHLFHQSAAHKFSGLQQRT